MKDIDFGECPYCGGKLIPIWFTDKEVAIDKYGHLMGTGRRRTAISHLTCEYCLINRPIDDSFDGSWNY